MMKVVWDEWGVPRSPLFDDKYFCDRDGHADALHVFCGGNHLRERFAALDQGRAGRFTIIETGFGTGLDFCTVWQLWNELAPRSWQLHFISLELYPLGREDIERALAVWSPLAGFCREFLAHYVPEPPGGTMRAQLDAGKVLLDIVFNDVVAALALITHDKMAPQGADAFFLDGFAPSKNPDMWTPEVYAGVAGLSRPGTTFATFTAAGHVRRGLESAGFLIARPPGYAGKRSILTGTFSGKGSEAGSDLLLK